MEENTAMDSRAGGFALKIPDDLSGVTWSLRADPRRVPNKPKPPELESPGMSQEERLTKTKTALVKITAFDSHLIGLTNKGHVLKLFGALSNEDNFEWTARRQYVTSPCIVCVMLQVELTYGAVGEFQRSFESRHISRLPRRDENTGLQAPRSLQITHVIHGTFFDLTRFLRYSTIYDLRRVFNQFKLNYIDG